MSPKVSEAYKKAKKAKLIHAAKRVFIQKGYSHTTMQDIMDEAGVSRGALYSYFDNIEHAFLEVLQSDDQQEIVFLKPNQSSSLWSQLTNWVQGQQHHIETIQQSLLLARAEFFLSAHSMGNKEHVPYLIQRYHRLQEAIQEFIQSGIKQGEFQPQLPPRSVSLYLISFLDGLMLDTFQLGSERTNVEEQLHALLFSLKQMLCPIEKKA